MNNLHTTPAGAAMCLQAGQQEGSLWQQSEKKALADLLACGELSWSCPQCWWIWSPSGLVFALSFSS